MDKKETIKKRKLEGRSIFDIISEKIFYLLSNGIFGKFFTSYDEANEKYLQSVKRKKKRVENGKIKKKISRTVEKSAIVKYFPRLVERLLRASTNNYGIVLLTMGIIIAMSYFLNGYILVMEITLPMLISGLAICIIGMPLLFSKKSISENLTKSKLCNVILFTFLGLDREKMRQVSEKDILTKPSIALLFGFAFGILSFLVTPFKLLLIIGAVILAYCVLLRPEVGVVSVIIMLPFVPVIPLQASVLYVLFCYFLKCMLGKRTFKFEQFDVWVVLLLVATVVRGSVSIRIIDSLTNAATTANMILFYFVVTNLIRTKEWFRRCLASLVFSGIGVALIGIFQTVIGKISVYVPNLVKLFTDGQSAVGTFDNPNTFAHYLVAIIPFSIVHFISERGGKKKTNGVLIGLVMLIALCLANSLSGIIGIIVATLLLLTIYNRNFSYLTLAICVLCPILYFTLPQNALKEILSIKMFDGVSINGIIAETRESFELIIEKPFGIGLGKEVFNSTFGSTEGCVDNLILQNIIEYGIIVSLVFVIFILMFMRLTFSYCTKAKNQYRKINCCVGFCAVVGLIASGVINYTWYDKRIFLVFWILVALSFAYVRIERDEEEPEGLADNYTFATLDITLDEEHHTVETQKRRYVRIPKYKKSKKETIDESEIQRKYEEFENSSEYKISGLKTKKPIEIENTAEVDIVKIDVESSSKKSSRKIKNDHADEFVEENSMKNIEETVEISNEYAQFQNENVQFENENTQFENSENGLQENKMSEDLIVDGDDTTQE